jgi:hypothetical protein
MCIRTDSSETVSYALEPCQVSQYILNSAIRANTCFRAKDSALLELILQKDVNTRSIL